MLTKDVILNKDYERLMRLIGADVIFCSAPSLRIISERTAILISVFISPTDVMIKIRFMMQSLIFSHRKGGCCLFERVIPLLLFQVAKKGKPMAYKSYRVLVEFRLRCLKQYWDTKKLRNLQGTGIEEIPGKDRMNWLPEEKDIFTSKQSS